MSRSPFAWCVTLCALASLVACEDERKDLSNASCAELGAHLEALCGDGIWSLEAAEIEEDCAIFGIGQDERACLARLTRCDESLGDCGFSSTTWVCDRGDEDCPPGLRCDLEQEECFACFTDAECGSRLCVDHHCIRDTPRNRSLAELIEQTEDRAAPDAGTGSASSMN
jgi:hypothetical protein